MKYLITIILLISYVYVWGTHNRAGEITYRQLGPLTIEVTVTTYTKTSSIAADRDSVEVVWGDGSRRWVRRANGNGQPLPNDIKFNIYIATHTYPGIGTYTISMTDPNRNGGIINLNPPNSENVLFHLETTFTLLSPQFQGFNSSPVLLQPPIDIGCVGQPFIHNPNAFDPDGDSLAYELVIPLQDRGVPVPNYFFPQLINPGPNNTISLNPVTGDFIWTSPQRAGEYNIAILIKEYRQGVLINTLIRDMQILIQDRCENRPPVIETTEEICVIAGELIDIEITVTDPDRNPPQLVALTATGGPLQLAVSPAALIVSEGYRPQPLIGRLRWQTTCDHVSNTPYVVQLRAVDNAFGGINGLSTLKRIVIKVIGPPVEEARTETDGEVVTLKWDFPYPCDPTVEDYFRGFAIWRRNSSNPFEIDSCAPTMAGKGYTRIAFNQRNQDGVNYNYTDNTIEKGKTYCYRIVPEFARLSLAGNPFNLAEGIPSEEICIQLSRDVPIITRVSVLETDAADGVMEIKWSKPIVPDLDTLEFPGPYYFDVWRANGITIDNFEPIPGANFISQHFATIEDTIYIDNNLNTVGSPYSYRIDFSTGADKVRYGGTNPASSVYLNVAATDRRNVLTWNFRVPWENIKYEIYRSYPEGAPFELIAQVNAANYTDRGLLNEEQYCYYILAIGTYGIDQIEDPLLNLSQIVCAVPIDTVPPCPPVLAVDNDCELIQGITGIVELFNRLTWSNPRLTCLDSEDAESYRIYYAPPGSDEFEIVASINDINLTDFQYVSEFGLAGCFAITSVDINGNESPFSNIVCKDNCPDYRLPNTFTPNGDGFNDLFVPTTNRFVSRVDFKVYNIWGQLVFETNDPLINWNGTTRDGNELAEGTYHYTCRVFETRQEGVIEQSNILSGFIQLIR
jgi:gliding motility-associated-like protein